MATKSFYNTHEKNVFDHSEEQQNLDLYAAYSDNTILVSLIFIRANHRILR